MTISLNTKKRRKSRSAKSSTPGDPGISLFVFSHRTKSTNSLISPSDQELRSRVENIPLVCLLHMSFNVNTSWDPYLSSILPQNSSNTTLCLSGRRVPLFSPGPAQAASRPPCFIAQSIRHFSLIPSCSVTDFDLLFANLIPVSLAF